MAASPKVQLEEELQCPVCLEQYKDPKILPCHHSFCRECLGKTPLELVEGRRDLLKCPTCRKPVQLPNGGVSALPPSFFINNLLELHRKVQSVSPNSTRNQSNNQCPCPEHHKPLEMYCSDCDKVICSYCITHEHRGHKCDLASEVYETCVNRVNELLDSKDENAKSASAHSFDKLDKEMLKESNTVREQMGESGKEKMKTLNQLQQELLKEIDKTEPYLEKDTFMKRQLKESENVYLSSFTVHGPSFVSIMFILFFIIILIKRVDNPILDSSVLDGPAPDSSVLDGPAPDSSVLDGPAQDSPVLDGPAPDSSVLDGPAPDSSVLDGPAQDSPVLDGPAPDSSVLDGPAPDSSVLDGPAPDTPKSNDDPTLPESHIDEEEENIKIPPETKDNEPVIKTEEEGLDLESDPEEEKQFPDPEDQEDEDQPDFTHVPSPNGDPAPSKSPPPPPFDEEFTFIPLHSHPDPPCHNHDHHHCHHHHHHGHHHPHHHHHHHPHPHHHHHHHHGHHHHHHHHHHGHHHHRGRHGGHGCH